MSPEQQQLEAGIAALRGQRALLGDVVVDVRGMFEVDANEPMAVKGVDAPLQSYLWCCAPSRASSASSRAVSRA
jgi:hypothetical protein